MDVLTLTNGSSAARRTSSAVAGLALRVGIAVTAGLAWGTSDALLALVPFVFASFWHARTRTEAFLVVWTYHMVAARGLVVGGARLFELSHAHATSLVGLCAAVVALVWSLCWHPQRRATCVLGHVTRSTVLLMLTILPPLGALAVPHPLSASGCWFPGWGWLGLGLVSLAACAMRSVRWGVLPSALVALMSLLRANGVAPSSLDMEAVSTRFGTSRDDVGDFVRQWTVAHDVMERVARARASIVVLPEGVGGLWSAPMQAQWADTDRALRARRQTALVGVTQGSVVEPLTAGIEAIGATRGSYRQRVAIPLAMWRPGSSAFAPAWLGPGTLAVRLANAQGSRGIQVGLFVCWEIGVVWCVLGSVAEGAEVLVVAANTGWLAGTSTPRAQAQMLDAWGALFGVPTVLAANT